ncbi:hypothetical protein ACFLZN_00590 [Nanoarchaeota archaeon]
MKIFQLFSEEYFKDFCVCLIVEEKTLIWISSIVLIIGIPILFVLVQNLEVNEKTVSISGKVQDSFSTNQVTIVTVVPVDGVPVVIFDEINITEGDDVSFNGTLADYQGRVELLVK